MQRWASMVLLTVSLGAGMGARHWASLRVAAGPGLPAPGSAKVTAETAPAARSAGPRPDEAEVAGGRSPQHFRSLVAWLAGATPDELSRMASASMGWDDDLSVRLVLARWAEVDPSGMMAWVEAQPGTARMSQKFLVANAWEARGRVDFDGTWKSVTDERMRLSILLGLTASDPERALEILRRNPALAGQSGFTSVGSVLGRIAARFPREAAAFAEAHVPGEWEPGMTIGNAWSVTDPAGALKWALQQKGNALTFVLGSLEQNVGCEGQVPLTADIVAALPALPGRSRVQAALALQLAGSDPAAAMAYFSQLRPGADRGFTGMKLLEKFTGSGRTEEALKLAESLGWRYEPEWFPDFISRKAANAPGGGLSVGNDFSFSDYSPYIQSLNSLAIRVAEKDPGAALGILKSGASDEVCAAVAPALREHRAEMMEALGATRARSGVARTVLGSWLQENPAAAVSWVQAKGPEDAMAATFCEAWAASDVRALVEWGGQGPYAANTWRAILGANPALAVEHLEDAAAAVPRELANAQAGLEQNDPALGQKLLPLLPDDVELGPSAMNRWMERQPDEAAQWVESLPAGTRRTSATASIARWYQGQGEFDAAWRWATVLPPGGQNDDMLAATF